MLADSRNRAISWSLLRLGMNIIRYHRYYNNFLYAVIPAIGSAKQLSSRPLGCTVDALQPICGQAANTQDCQNAFLLSIFMARNQKLYVLQRRSEDI